MDTIVYDDTSMIKLHQNQLATVDKENFWKFNIQSIPPGNNNQNAGTHNKKTIKGNVPASTDICHCDS